MHIGSSRGDRMNDFRLAVHADMRFHAEVPLVALLCLMHLGIPLLGPVLRRTGRTDNRRIHDGPVAELQPVRRQIVPDSCKELLVQLVIAK